MLTFQQANEEWNTDPRGEKWSDVRAAQAQVARLDRWIEEAGPGSSSRSRLAKWEGMSSRDEAVNHH